MKNALKRSLSVFLAITIIFSSAVVGLNEIDFSEINFNGINFSSVSQFLKAITPDFSVKSQAASSGTCGDNLTWTLDDVGTLTISGTGDMTNFSFTADIPWYTVRSSITTVVLDDGVTSIGDDAFSYCYSLTSVVIGDSVTSIGGDAFYNCYSLTSIEIPDSVTSIGGYAFESCTSLTSIEIPDSVTSIGGYAFESCTSLTSITIPDSVTSIGYNAFHNCSSLTVINTDENNEYFSSVDGVLFNKDKTTLIKYPAGKTATEYTTPDSVTSISYSAFYKCYSLTSVVIGDSVTSIAYNAFGNCTSLKSITIPDSVTSIGDSAFYNCSSLTDVYYRGLLSDWDNIIIDFDNAYLTKATISHLCTPGDWMVNTEPTCTEEGLRSAVCVVCGDVVSEAIGIIEHSYSSEWTIDVEPTCTKEGSRSTDCIVCGDVVTEPIATIAHNCSTEWTIDLEPSCAKDGSKSHHCIDCGYKADVTSIVALGHYFENDICVKCNNSLDDALLSVVKTGVLESAHNYSNNTSQTKSFTAEGADYVTVEFSSSTSVESNYDYIYIYDGSGTLIGKYTGTTLANKTIEVNGDTVKIKLTSDTSEVKYGYYAECTGYAELTCNNHLHKKFVNVAEETCAIDGYTGDLVCAVCEEVCEEGTVIPAFGHSYGDWVVTKEPTCAEEGSKNKTCSVCGGVVIEAIATIEHNYSTEWTIDREPTCGEDGSKSRHCLGCGNKTDATNIVALGHYFENDICVKCNENLVVALGVAVKTGVLESSHNYSNNTNQTQTFTASGSDYVAVAFSSDTCVETGWDNIYIYDSADDLVGIYTGIELANQTINVRGETVKIKLTSDGGVTYYGYYATCTGYTMPDTCNDHLHTKLANMVDMTCSNDGYTGDVVCAICEKVFESGEVIISGHNYVYGSCVFCEADCPFDYYIENGEVEINGYYGSEVDVTIPQVINGYPVTKVDIWDSDIICINIPGNNTTVELNCENVVEIVLGEGVTSFDFRDSANLVAIEVDENNAYYSDIDGVLFNKDQTTLIKYPCQKTETSYTVPNTVTRIEDEAFSNTTRLANINLGDNVSSIGVTAFYNTGYYNEASNWENGLLYIDNYLVDGYGSIEDLLNKPLSIKDGTTVIADSLFFVNALLATSIDIPASVEYLGFGDAEILFNLSEFLGFDSALVSINVDSNNEHYVSEDGVLFNKDKTELIFYPMEKQGSTYQIPSSVEKICTSAFALNENLRDIVIPSTVKTVDEAAFIFSRLDSVVVEDGVSRIGDGCFVYSTVEEVTIGNVDYIGYGAFYFSAAERVVLGDAGYIGEYAFYSLNIKYLELCGKIDYADRYALFMYDGIAVMSADSVTSGQDGLAVNIGTLYFDGTPEQLSKLMENETVISVPEQTEVIYGKPYKMGQYADFLYIETDEGEIEIYDYLGNAEDVVVPEYIGNKPVTGIGATFKNYVIDVVGGEGILTTNLKSVVVPETVTELSWMAFFGNMKLVDIVLPSGLRSVHSSSFEAIGYTMDESNWENGVLYLDNYLIGINSDCGKKLDVKNGTTLIADGYYWNNKITSISIPESVKYIGEGLFEDCANLTYIFFGGSEEAWSEIGIDTDSEALSNVIIHYNTLNHISSDWIVDAEPTYTEIGSKHKECTVCGCILKTESIPVLTGFEFTAIGVNSYKLTAYNGAATDITIPATHNNCPVTAIGNSCFRNNTTIQNVIIPSSVTEIGYLAFFGCTNLETIYIPSSVTTIASQAFNSYTGTIICYKGSYAHQYAMNNGLNYRVVSIEAATTETTIDFNKSIVFTSVEVCTNISKLISSPAMVEILPVASQEGAGVEYYGTGTALEVFESNKYIGSYTLIVEGDLNGDSVVDVLDAAVAQLYSAGFHEPTENEILAANGCVSDEIDVLSYQNVVNTVLAS